MTLRLLILALVLLGWNGLAVADVLPTSSREVCQTFQPKPSNGKIVAEAPASKPSVPTGFEEMISSGVGPNIVFLGDSLTKNEDFPSAVAKEMGSRAYEVFAIGGQSSTVLSSLFEKVEVDPAAVGVIWIGRNDEPKTDGGGLLDNIRKAKMRFQSGRFLVLSYLSGRFEAEQPGQTKRLLIDALNDRVRSEFADRYVDVRPLLTCADFKDNIHLTKIGYEKIAHAVSLALQARGW